MRATPTLGYLMERAVLKTVVLLTVALVWMGSVEIGHGYAETESDERIELARPAASGSPRELIARYDCWTGNPPLDMVGRIPGHAVITIGYGPPTYVGTNGVDQALQHVFEKRHPNIDVHAFCR